MSSRTRIPLAATAAVGTAVVLALASPAVASEAGGVPGAPDTSRPRDQVTLDPATGAAGTTVAVRALCAGGTEDAAVFSPAFQDAAALRRGTGGGMVAEATVRRGLAPGRAYVVTANCSPSESLTTTFVYAAAAGTAIAPARDAGTGKPDVGTGAGTEAGTGERAEEGDPNRVDGVALAFGGGLAGAALAGYVLTARRAASRRRAVRAVGPRTAGIRAGRSRSARFRADIRRR